MSEMHLLMRYFSHFDGNKTWDEIAPIVDDTFHEDFEIMDTSKQTYNKQEFTAKLKEFVMAGGWMEVLKLKVASPYKTQGIRYEVVFHHPNDVQSPTVLTKSVASFCPTTGKLLRVQRDNVRNVHQIL